MNELIQLLRRSVARITQRKGVEDRLEEAWPSWREALQVDKFRPGQAEAVAHLLEGHDCLVVMPTGSGKSLVYQLTSQCLPGPTLVVTPLIALMLDQVAGLHRRGIPACLLNSQQSEAEQQHNLECLAQGRSRLLYVAPERLRNPRFLEALGQVKVSLLAIDEAHCISQWGHDFRPDYLALAQLRERLGRPQTVALTATATPQVQREIIATLKLQPCRQVVTGFDRPNLGFFLTQVDHEWEKLDVLRDCLEHRPGPVLIYTGTRRGCEELAGALEGPRPVYAYHAGLAPRVRNQAQQAFMSEPEVVVVATNAFGMGIDRPDLGLVVHHTLPGSLEAYYQEAGRAGRDGRPARAVLLYCRQDQDLHHYFISQSAPSLGEYARIMDALPAAKASFQACHRVGLDYLERGGFIERRASGWAILRPWNEAAAGPLLERARQIRDHKWMQLQAMLAYCETQECRRRVLVGHFGERLARRPAQCCDNCNGC